MNAALNMDDLPDADTPAEQLGKSTLPPTLKIVPAENRINMPTGKVRHTRVYPFAKRVFDIVFAMTMLVLLSPVWLIAAVLVRITSPGHAIFRQSRVGQHGTPFTCLKLRTMVPEAHSLKVEIVDQNETTGPVFKIRADPRIIPIGRALRKFSIDELPQLVNVLKGEMSIVGPRPALPEEVEKYSPHQRGRLAVKPGLTCLWQVSGRSNIGFDEWVELDLEYIRRRNFWFDLWLILLTIPAVLSGRGAY